MIDEWDEEFDRGKVSAGCVPGGAGGWWAGLCPDPRAFLLPLRR